MVEIVLTKAQAKPGVGRAPRKVSQKPFGSPRAQARSGVTGSKSGDDYVHGRRRDCSIAAAEPPPGIDRIPTLAIPAPAPMRDARHRTHPNNIIGLLRLADHRASGEGRLPRASARAG